MELFEEIDHIDIWTPLIDSAITKYQSSSVQLLLEGDKFCTVDIYNMTLLKRIDGGTQIKFDIKGGLIVSVLRGRLTIHKTENTGRKFKFLTGNCIINNNELTYPKHVEWAEEVPSAIDNYDVRLTRFIGNNESVGSNSGYSYSLHDVLTTSGGNIAV